MTRLTHLLLAASSAAILAACSQSETASSDGAQSADGEGADSSTVSAGMDQDDMDHSEMMQDHMGGDGMAAAEASAQGVLEAIDREAGSVTVTHPPMPEIGWPEMTMEIPVTGTVDLSGFSEGNTVQFTVRRGRDDVFRIVEMTSAGADE